MFGRKTRQRIELLEQENEILSDRIEQILFHLQLDIRPHFHESAICTGEECYDDMTFAELSKIRKERISELKQVDKKMKEFAIAIGRSTAGGGNYKR